MTRIGIFLAVCVVTAGCKKADQVDQVAQQPRNPGFSDAGAGAVKRIGAYLQSSVVNTKLRSCWGQLRGQGAIAMDLTYSKAGDKWALSNVKVTNSSLQKGQDAIAQRCMEDAAHETSWDVDSNEALEKAAPQFVVRLGWPVPLPPENTPVSDQQIASMIGTGGSGGLITVPGCSNCVSNPQPPYGLKCEAKSSGSNVDCESISSNVCATTPKACVRGSWGGSRGVIMF